MSSNAYFWTASFGHVPVRLGRQRRCSSSRVGPTRAKGQMVSETSMHFTSKQTCKSWRFGTCASIASHLASCFLCWFALVSHASVDAWTSCGVGDRCCHDAQAVWHTSVRVGDGLDRHIACCLECAKCHPEAPFISTLGLCFDLCWLCAQRLTGWSNDELCRNWESSSRNIFRLWLHAQLCQSERRQPRSHCRKLPDNFGTLNACGAVVYQLACAFLASCRQDTSSGKRLLCSLTR